MRASDRRPPEVYSGTEAWEVRAAPVAGSRCNLRAVPFRLTPAANRAQGSGAGVAADRRRRSRRGACGHGVRHPMPAFAAIPRGGDHGVPGRLLVWLHRAFALLVGPPSGINASITKSTAYFNLQPAFPPELFAGSGISLRPLLIIRTPTVHDAATMIRSSE